MSHLHKNIVCIQNTLFQVQTIFKLLKSISVEGDDRQLRTNNSQFPEVAVGDGDSTLVERFVEFVPLEVFGGHVREDKSWGTGNQVGIGFPVDHSLERDGVMEESFGEAGFTGSGIAIEDQNFGSTWKSVGCLKKINKCNEITHTGHISGGARSDGAGRAGPRR